MTSGNPRERLLDALAGELHVGPLARRRILRELADHIDDAVDDLRSEGVLQEEALDEAVKRLGDAETIASAFGALHTRTGGLLRPRHSLAWVAVAAMSLATALAAELPQASGAKPPAKAFAPGLRRQAPASRPSTRRPGARARTAARSRHRDRAGRG